MKKKKTVEFDELSVSVAAVAESWEPSAGARRKAAPPPPTREHWYKARSA